MERITTHTGPNTIILYSQTGKTADQNFVERQQLFQNNMGQKLLLYYQHSNAPSV